MSQFHLEQQLQQALRLDSNITFNSSMNRSRATVKTPAGSSKRQAQSTGRSIANSSLLNNSLNRSRVLGVQQPAQTSGINRSISSSRLGLSPGRNGNRNRSSSAGRGSIGGDRFIPNRSTTDLEQAHHSLVNANDNLLSSDSSENVTEHQRLQLAQQTAEILNVSKSKVKRLPLTYFKSFLPRVMRGTRGFYLSKPKLPPLTMRMPTTSKFCTPLVSPKDLTPLKRDRFPPSRKKCWMHLT